MAGGNKIELLDNFEKSLIEETLKRQGGNLQATARKLGVHRSTLWRKIKRHHIAVTKV
ncbi:MAG: hypothetical protein JXD19_04575 [Deltaproteobacteria bacterium]|nr:hypothetical protein [Deltaproteobacteria bacterium]